MGNPLLTILRTGIVTQNGLFPELPSQAAGMPGVAAGPCLGESCRACSAACPTGAISIEDQKVSLDRGKCIGCGACLPRCPTGILVEDRATATAVIHRDELILTNAAPRPKEPLPATPFERSLHVREVATGDSASDMEASAATNSVFDVARFGVHFVASPRHADALLVSGPVPVAMQDPLRRCYDAMSEPRIVIAMGTSAISGGVFAGGYAKANGVDSILPVSVYVPGDPPHPWSVIHGLLLAMGRIPSPRLLRRKSQILAHL